MKTTNMKRIKHPFRTMFFLLILLVACNSSSRTDRKVLEDQNIPWSEAEFLNRVMSGDAETVRLFIAGGMGPNTADKKGSTALMLAAIFGHTPVVQALLDAGSSLNVADRFAGRTALMYAAERGHAAIVKTLVSAGAEVNVKDAEGRTALMLATSSSHTETVQALLAAGAAVNAGDRHEMTALIIAAQLGHTDIVQALLAAGADVHAKEGFNGGTALMWAVGNDHTAVVKALLDAGADLNAKDHDGTTALRIASERGRSEIVQLLKRAGAER